MITPQFPYSGSQVILTSDRLVFHSKKDGIFLFGKATIGLSSPSTINLDSNEAVKIDSPTIELGHRAKDDGEPVVLGDSLTAVLQDLVGVLGVVAQSLMTGTTGALPPAGSELYKTVEKIKAQLTQGEILSDNTFTA